MLISLFYAILSEFYRITKYIDNLVYSTLGINNVEPALVRKVASMFCFGFAALLLIYDWNDTKQEIKQEIKKEEVKKEEVNEIITNETENIMNSPTSSVFESPTQQVSPIVSAYDALNSVKTELAAKIIMESDYFIKELVSGICVCKIKGPDQVTNEMKTYKLTGKGYLISEKTGIFGQLSQNYKLSRLNHIFYKDKDHSTFVLKFVGTSSVKLLEIRAFEGNSKTVEYYNGFLSVMKRAKLDNNRKWFRPNISFVDPGKTPADSTTSSIISTPVAGLSRSNSVDNLSAKVNKLATLEEVENESNNPSPNISPARSLSKLNTNNDDIIFSMEIETNKDNIEILDVRAYDNPDILASEFSKQHNLTSVAEKFIASNIKERQLEFSRK
jgi:hypothetical protein